VRGFVWALLAGICFASAAVTRAADDDEFVVKDLRVVGLQRIAEGTVYNYLPVNIGDRLDRQREQEAFRALYATGFFDDVQLRRDGDTLVIVVKERPSIASFEITGNKDIKTDDLLESMRNAGLAPGRSFDRSVLDNVTQFLTQQYFERGKYAVRVDPSVTEVAGNKVNIHVVIEEGARARIRQINIVGNETFTDDELRSEFQLKTPHFLSFYKKDDRYARESLAGDLEHLQSYYMDRGFANFAVESTQVAISPDKQDMFITVNIHEGERYTVSDAKISGDLVVPEQELLGLVLTKPGQIYSRKLIEDTTHLIELRLGRDGYAFARIDPIPNIDEEKKQVALTFYIDPGKRVYVRRIDFKGTNGVDDYVFRREMRQLEGAYLSNTSVDRSEARIRRLPFVEEVSKETVPVAGADDLVDVEFDIKEGLPGQFGGGIGYSGTQGILLNGNFTHSNFMGTGNRVAAELTVGSFSKVYSLSHTNPYWTPDGKSLGLQVAYRDSTQFISGGSDFSTETVTASFEFGVPLSEFARFRYGASYSDASLVTGTFSSTQAQAFVQNNGNPYTIVEGSVFGTKFNAYELFSGWTRDSRDRVLMASRGARHDLSLSVTAPGSEVEYYIARYDMQKYWALGGRWILELNSELGYGRPLGDTTDLPPYRNFFAGGSESVRGFDNGRLGPRDSRNNPYGGNAKFVSQLNLFFPTPEKFGSKTRFGIFYDIGNVFYTGDTKFCRFDNNGVPCNFDADGDGIVDAVPIEFKPDFNELRSSVGIGVEWIAPLGTFRFSYAVPLNASDFDLTEGFQFSVGQGSF
jgi:outer membrane protein insertion porin family